MVGPTFVGCLQLFRVSRITLGDKDFFLLMKKIYLVLGIVEKKPYLCTIHLGITYKVQIITYSFKI